MNRLKNSAINFNNLGNNGQYKLAINHSVMLYKSNSLYSFIPKNACSTLRLSAAIENGCIDNIKQGHWIHANNDTFNASLGEALKADYTFVILRCPFRRLVSVFLDKFVSKEPDAWLYRNNLERKVELDELTFREFLLSLLKPMILNSNIHWKFQNSFLLYEEYSDYFSLENFEQAIKTLRDKIDFNVVDARSLTNHGVEKLKVVHDQNYADTPAFDIALMKRNGECPSYASFYDKELIELVRKLYKIDIELYSNHFDSSDLLFPY